METGGQPRSVTAPSSSKTHASINLPATVTPRALARRGPYAPPSPWVQQHIKIVRVKKWI